MLTPDQAERLIAQFRAEIRLPIDSGDRLDVAGEVITSVILRLAPMVELVPTAAEALPATEEKPEAPN